MPRSTSQTTRPRLPRSFRCVGDHPVRHNHTRWWTSKPFKSDRRLSTRSDEGTEETEEKETTGLCECLNKKPSQNSREEATEPTTPVIRTAECHSYGWWHLMGFNIKKIHMTNLALVKRSWLYKQDLRLNTEKKKEKGFFYSSKLSIRLTGLPWSLLIERAVQPGVPIAANTDSVMIHTNILDTLRFLRQNCSLGRGIRNNLGRNRCYNINWIKKQIFRLAAISVKFFGEKWCVLQIEMFRRGREIDELKSWNWQGNRNGFSGLRNL